MTHFSEAAARFAWCGPGPFPGRGGRRCGVWTSVRPRGRACLFLAGLVVATSMVLPGQTAAEGPAPLTDSSRDVTLPADTIPGPDSLATPREVRFVLPPVLATGERDLATPPPVVTRRMDGEILARTPAENPWQMLSRAVNLEVLDPGQGPGLAPNAVLRGFASDHSTEVLLVIDGIPVNLPVHGHAEGYSDWNVLFPGAVRTFRIIHGPASPLHGDYSLSGTIEVFTHSDLEGTAGGVTASSFGDVEGWFLTGFQEEGGGGVAGVQLRSNEGWRDNSDALLSNVLLRGWRRVGDSRVEGGIMLYGSRYNSPGFLPRLSFTERRLTGAIDPTDGGRSGRAILHGRAAHPIGPDTFVQAGGWLQFSDWKNFGHVPGHGNEQRGEQDRRAAAGLQLEGLWTPEQGELTVGVESAHHAAHYDLLFTRERETLHAEARVAASRTAASGYLRWRQELGGRIGLDLGGRLDLLSTTSEAREGANPGGGEDSPGFGHDTPFLEGSATAVVFSPRIGMRWLVTERSSLLGSFTRGVRSAQGVLGDPGRVPVQAWTAQVGVELERGPVQGDFALFRTHVSNERIRDPLTMLISSAGNSVRQGAEGMLAWNPSDRIQLEGGAAYTHSRFDGSFFESDGSAGAALSAVPGSTDVPGDTNVPGNTQPAGHVNPAGEILDPSGLLPDFHVALPQSEWVPGIQLWRGFLRGEWLVSERISLRGDVRVQGPYVPVGEPYHETAPYTLLGAGATFALGGHWYLDLDGANLADSVYPAVRASGFVIPGTPRTLHLGVRRVRPN